MSDVRTRLAVRPLEPRDVPSTVALGDGWSDAANLTLSFAPDGTLIGEPPAGIVDVNTTAAALTGTLGLGGLNSLLSPLTGSLNGLTGSLTSGPDSRSNTHMAFGQLTGWQREVLRAFQTWAVATNLNIGLAADAGSTFGSAGAFQGDSRFGDIRIGGTQLDRSALANAMIVSPSNGTWSGDVLFNTAIGWSTSGGWDKYDLFTVALHEAGHVFGLEHSDDPLSVMSESYWGARSGLSASDLATVRSYYGGARRADAFDLAGANDTQAAASLVTVGGNFTLTGDRTTSSDTDWYAFNVSAAGTLTVKLKTSGISLFTGRLSVLDAAGRVVGTATATDPTRGDLTINLTTAAAGRYFLKVDSAAADAFGIGRYQLSVSGLGGEPVNVAPPTFDSTATPTYQSSVLASGTLSKSASRSETTYTMSTSGLFRLSADATSTVSGASLIVEVFDASGNKVLSFSQSANGGSGAGSAYLQAGTYTVRTTAVLPLLSWGGKVNYTLYAGVESDPMGTTRPGTTTSPYPTTGSGSTPTSTTTSTTSQPTSSSTTTRPYSY
jgi:hypothetical protein